MIESIVLLYNSIDRTNQIALADVDIRDGLARSA